ncbi:MAG TPA: hypothetical protein VFW47_15610 [Phenylobacterium sp.]|nr:hypothetical protein [Phenylobacterium sp.]
MTFAKIVAIGLLAAGLSGCVQSRTHLSSDFGAAVRQDVAAQIADPDARYRGDPAPGSDGARTALSQERYRTGKVTQPVASISTIGVSGAAASPQR